MINKDTLIETIFNRKTVNKCEVKENNNQILNDTEEKEKKSPWDCSPSIIEKEVKPNISKTLPEEEIDTNQSTQKLSVISDYVLKCEMENNTKTTITDNIIKTPIINDMLRTPLELYLDTLIHKPYFEFLHHTIKNNQMIRMRLDSEFPVFDKDIKTHDDNFIYYPNNTVRYFGNDEWNKLYRHLVESKEISSRITDCNFDMSSCMKKVRLKFNENVPGLLEAFESYLKCYPHYIEQVLYTTLQKIIYSSFRKHGNEEASEMGLTSLSCSLGESIFKDLLNESTSYFKIFNFNVIISESTLLLINQILTSILENDDKLIKQLYKSNYIYNGKSKAMRNFLSKYILYQCCRLYSKKELPSILEATLSPYWKSYNEHSVIFDMEAQLAKCYAKIGVVVVDSLVKGGLCEIYTFYKNNQEQYRVKFNPHLINYFLDNLNIFRPLLVQSNLSYIIENAKKSNTFSVILENYEKVIHPNPNMKLVITPDCYLRKYKPQLKLTIDRNYLQYFLAYLDSISTIPIIISNCHRFHDILDIYDIDSNSFERIYYKSSLTERVVLIDLLKYALDFNTKISVNLKETIRNLGSTLINKMYNKILNNKLFIIGLLQDATLYSMYGYFISNTFFDTRGRCYLEGYHLNVQNFPFAKTFVKPFNYNSTNLISQHYSAIQDAFKENLKNTELKDAVDHISKDTFFKKQENDHISYLYKFFDSSKISWNDLASYLSSEFNPESCLAFVRANKKKKEYLFFVHSSILLHKNPIPLISNYYEVDASASGLQMTAILVCSIPLAMVCNLVGDKKTDIYSIAANEFRDCLKDLKNLIDNFKDVFNLSANIRKTRFSFTENEYNKLHRASLQEKFDILLNSDWKTSYKVGDLIQNICVLLEERFQKHYEQLNIKLIHEFSWIFNPYLKKVTEFYSLRNVDKTFLTYILIICKGIWFFDDLAVCDWIPKQELLFSRELFKKAVMTYGYNSTFKGRTDFYISFFQEHAPDDLIIDAFISSKLNSISWIVEYYFTLFRSKYLKDCQILKDISKLIATRGLLGGRPLVIMNKFFCISLEPYTIKASKVTIVNKETKRVLQLNIKHKTRSINYRALRSSFSPNFIHSMDAYIVNLLHELIFKINESLKRKQIDIYLEFFTNHDMFMMLLTPFLPIIIEDCYKVLIASNYITTLKYNNPELYKKIILNYFNKDRTEFYRIMKSFNQNYIK